MSIKTLFTEHPATVGETYTQHCGHALGFGWRMVLAGCACMVHAIVPALFVRTGSETVATLHDRMVVNRQRLSQREAARASTTIA
jgi:Family of unknown function (DUF6356)